MANQTKINLLEELTDKRVNNEELTDEELLTVAGGVSQQNESRFRVMARGLSTISVNAAV